VGVGGKYGKGNLVVEGEREREREEDGEREREAGLPVRLNRRIVSRPPSSLEGKWTFLGEKGEAGAEWARVWLVVGREEAMLGDDGNDLSDDLRGLPLERRIGVEEVRGRGDGGDGEGVRDAGDIERGGDREHERGKGIASEKSKSVVRERLKELFDRSLSDLSSESSSSVSGVVAQLLSEEAES
jgi:hypothetical protein